MRYNYLLFFLYTHTLSFSFFQKPTTAVNSRKKSVKISCYFTPYDNCTKEICNLIDKENEEICIMAYAFTCNNIINSLIKAKSRGVKIRILVDRTYFYKPYIAQLKKENINNIFIDQTPGIAHNKIMIFKKQDIILTGSFNFSNAAQKRNLENIAIIEATGNGKNEVFQQYLDYFEKRYELAVKNSKN